MLKFFRKVCQKSLFRKVNLQFFLSWKLSRYAYINLEFCVEDFSWWQMTRSMTFYNKFHCVKIKDAKVFFSFCKVYEKSLFWKVNQHIFLSWKCQSRIQCWWFFTMTNDYKFQCVKIISKRSIFQNFWKVHCWSKSLFFEIETSNFGSSYLFLSPLKWRGRIWPNLTFWILKS